MQLWETKEHFLKELQMGTVDMGIITNGPIVNFVEDIGVFELPFLFASPEEAYKVLDGEIGQKILDKLETVNIKGPCICRKRFQKPYKLKKISNDTGRRSGP